MEREARECPHKGRVPSLAENFPANHRLASPSAWRRGGSSDLRAVSPAWKFAWEPRDSRHVSASPASFEFRRGSGQGPLRGCASNSLKLKALEVLGQPGVKESGWDQRRLLLGMIAFWTSCTVWLQPNSLGIPGYSQHANSRCCILPESKHTRPLTCS